MSYGQKTKLIDNNNNLYLANVRNLHEEYKSPMLIHVPSLNIREKCNEVFKSSERIATIDYIQFLYDQSNVHLVHVTL